MSWKEKTESCRGNQIDSDTYMCYNMFPYRAAETKVLIFMDWIVADPMKKKQKTGGCDSKYFS